MLIMFPGHKVFELFIRDPPPHYRWPDDEMQSNHRWTLADDLAFVREGHLPDAHLEQSLEARRPAAEERTTLYESFSFGVFFLVFRLRISHYSSRDHAFTSPPFTPALHIYADTIWLSLYLNKQNSFYFNFMYWISIYFRSIATDCLVYKIYLERFVEELTTYDEQVRVFVGDDGSVSYGIWTHQSDLSETLSRIWAVMQQIFRLFNINAG